MTLALIRYRFYNVKPLELVLLFSVAEVSFMCEVRLCVFSQPPWRRDCCLANRVMMCRGDGLTLCYMRYKYRWAFFFFRPSVCYRLCGRRIGHLWTVRGVCGPGWSVRRGGQGRSPRDGFATAAVPGCLRPAGGA